MSYFPPFIASNTGLTNVASSITNVNLLALNNLRKGLLMFNDSSSVCYVKLGTTASTTSYTFQMSPNSLYVMTLPVYTGNIDAIWVTANGFMRITELS